MNGSSAVPGSAGLRVTGDTDDPTKYAWRFSPESNHKRQQVPPEQELRVIVATDVLSEGQNLQDAAIVVNYDLPWAIIRLVQRAGRVDRIGQKAETILCYSFLPADGVERILRLRTRVHQRLRENAEVVGTDEHFFEDDHDEQTIRDLFTEKSGILDDDPDSEVDLSSYAYQIWKNAIDRDPSLEKTIPALPEVVYSTRAHSPTENRPRGCWSMSARPRAMTPWHGWTARARTSPSRSLPSSRRPNALRTPRHCPAWKTTITWLPRACSSSPPRKKPSAVSLAGHRGPASAPTNG